MRPLNAGNLEMEIDCLPLVVDWLRSKNVFVRKDWIEFLLSHSPSNLSEMEEIKNWIFEQFLLTDLSVSSLPRLELPLNRSENTVVILQVEQSINISESFYSQIDKLNQQINKITNRIIDEEGEGEKDESSKSLFKYLLSDGHSFIYCLFLNSLSNKEFKVESGFKVAVKLGDISHFELENIYLINEVEIISTVKRESNLGMEKESLELLI